MRAEEFAKRSPHLHNGKTHFCQAEFTPESDKTRRRRIRAVRPHHQVHHDAARTVLDTLDRENSNRMSYHVNTKFKNTSMLEDSIIMMIIAQK
jgi:hypothetical protein